MGGNVYTWQALTPADSEYQDGRWRWMLYDLDDSLGAGIEAEQPYAIDSFTDHPGYSPCGFLDDDPMPSLMGNADFRRQFVITFMDLDKILIPIGYLHSWTNWKPGTALRLTKVTCAGTPFPQMCPLNSR